VGGNPFLKIRTFKYNYLQNIILAIVRDALDDFSANPYMKDIMKEISENQA